MFVASWLLDNSDSLKNIAEMLAFVGALLFFIWKVWTGYNIINLSINLDTRRARGNTTEHDWLVIKLTLTKGDRARLRLKAASLVILDLEGAEITSRKVPVIPTGKAVLRLSPGESTSFECCLEVPAGKPCEVQVEVRGHAQWHGGWRATAISLPIYDILAS